LKLERKKSIIRVIFTEALCERKETVMNDLRSRVLLWWRLANIGVWLGWIALVGIGMIFIGIVITSGMLTLVGVVVFLACYLFNTTLGDARAGLDPP